MNKDRFEHYTTVSWSGRELLKKHRLEEEGTWQIYGEDSNAELAGPHHEPYLGTVEGKLEDVIRYATTLQRWATWGGGGRIEKVSIISVNPESMARRARLKDELVQLEKRIKEIKDELE